MMAAYGINTRDPRVSLRRVWVLAQRLPPAFRLPGEPWTEEAHLLALLVDHMAQLTYVTIKAAGGKATRPKPLPRPPEREIERPAARAEPAAKPRQRRESSPAAVKHEGWAAAIGQLATLPGARVRSDG
jgi:hypothetical protein